MRNPGVPDQILRRRDDLRDAGLVVGAEQRQPRRRHDIVPELRGELGDLARAQHRRRIVGKHQIPPIVGPMNQGMDVRSRHLGRRVHVGHQSDDRNVMGHGRGNGGHHVSVLVEGNVLEADLAKFLDEDPHQHELAGCARNVSRSFVRAGVNDGVAKEAVEDGHRCGSASNGSQQRELR